MTCIISSLAREMYFELEYASPPSTPAIWKSASTAEGSAKGLMEGGYTIAIVLTNFVITHRINDLSIKFGETAAQILLLEQSDLDQTKIRVMVPSSAESGYVEMHVQH